MALNFSHRPIFPAHLPEENLVQGGSQDKDIRELLPADPFGMDISSTVTAITGWLEDLHLEAEYLEAEFLEAEYGCGYRANNNNNNNHHHNVGVGKGDYPVFAEWNFWWNAAAMEFQTLHESTQLDGRISKGSPVYGFHPWEDSQSWSRCLGYDGGVRYSCNLDAANVNRGGSFDSFDSYGYVSWEDSGLPVYDDWGARVPLARSLEDEQLLTGNAGFGGSGNEGNNNVGFVNHIGDDDDDDDDDDDGVPHPALSFALGYLGIRDLLSVERVCKSLCDTVRSDCLLWRNIHIDHPLNDRITDDVLLQLTNRAQGRLRCLSLVECQRVTDDGLKRVLNANPMLIKLSVPGCTRLSIDGVVNCLRAFQEGAVTGIKYLRVGGLFGVTHKHFEELMSLMGIDDNHVQANRYEPHFYHRDSVYLSYEDDRPIDIEMCPRCQNLRLVYDCPAECCQSNDHATQICRACTLCISRCVQCGKCINDGEYEETFCLELLCFHCWNQVVQSQKRKKRQKRQDVGTSPCNHAISEEEPVVLSHG